jgi:hypothetical protein
MLQYISMLKNKHNFHKTQTHEMRSDFVQSGRGLQPSRLQNEGCGMQIEQIRE